jgi:hypothetical protein
MLRQVLGLTARATAWAITVAAIAPIAETSARTDKALPVENAKIVLQCP